MRYPKLIVGFSLLALLLVWYPSNANDSKKQIKPTQTWSGKIGDDALSKAAPKGGYLTNQKALEELWTVWKLKNKPPEIDFTKQIVFVQLSGRTECSTFDLHPGCEGKPHRNFNVHADRRAWLRIFRRCGEPGTNQDLSGKADRGDC